MTTQTKPTTRRVYAVDCELSVGGETFLPHAEEWVEVVPVMSVGEYRALSGMGRLSQAIALAEGDPDAERKRMAAYDTHFEEMCVALAGRIRAWNWTNDYGEPIVPWNATLPDGTPYAKLDGSPAPFRLLRAPELYWLLTASEGETPSEGKAGSAPSPTTSSATGPRRGRRN